MNFGFNVNLDWLSKLVGGRSRRPGIVRLKKGAKYEIDGTWFTIVEVYPGSLVMQPTDPAILIERAE